MTLRVVHINLCDLRGGAAIAAWRLQQGLLARDVDVRMLVSRRSSQSDRVDRIPHATRIENLAASFTRRFGLPDAHLRSTARLANHPWVREADVIHLHNLHSGYFNFKHLARVVRGKAVVWTLHDMWSLTGHCAYAFDCPRWQTGCGRCPDLTTYPPIARDRTAAVWRMRDRVYQQIARDSRMTIVTPSRWLGTLAGQGLLKRFAIRTVPNGLDTTVYQPIDRTLSRQALGLADSDRVILCAADSLADPRKGSDQLVAALQQLPRGDQRPPVLMTLGEGADAMGERLAMPVHNLGYVSGDRLKALAFSAADVFVHPTRADNLPVVLQESMACGTPMVAFDVGGVADLVREGETGLLAPAGDAASLSSRIDQLLGDPDMRQTMGHRCREIAVAEYDLATVTDQYLAIYASLLGDAPR